MLRVCCGGTAWSSFQNCSPPVPLDSERCPGRKGNRAASGDRGTPAWPAVCLPGTLLPLLASVFLCCVLRTLLDCWAHRASASAPSHRPHTTAATASISGNQNTLSQSLHRAGTSRVWGVRPSLIFREGHKEPRRENLKGPESWGRRWSLPEASGLPVAGPRSCCCHAESLGGWGLHPGMANSWG